MESKLQDDLHHDIEMASVIYSRDPHARHAAFYTFFHRYNKQALAALQHGDISNREKVTLYQSEKERTKNTCYELHLMMIAGSDLERKLLALLQEEERRHTGENE